MTTSYGTLCDDFYVNMRVNTELELPSDRDTILHFYDRLQKQYPSMNTFFQRDEGEFCLSGDTELGSYRRIVVGSDHVFSGFYNPENFDDVDDQNQFMLDQIPYALGINHLDINNLELLYGMDFDYDGNHDEIFAEALFRDTPFSSLLDNEMVQPLGFDPEILIGLTKDCRFQAKLTLESRTGAYQARTGKYSESGPLSLFMIVRNYPDPSTKFDSLEAYQDIRGRIDELMNDKIIPNFVTPIVGALSHRR